ncbi:MAG: YbjN domain-containing protein [Selenomonadaceae bacterium]|nr:YbjN domain-containing protein [Selenomonadaceae bacterium]
MEEMEEARLNYAEIVEKYFTDNDWNFTAKKIDDDIFFSLPLGAKNLPGLDVKLIVDTDGDCKIRCYLAKGVADKKRDEMLEVLNSLNTKYRYVTLSLDTDNDVLASYDFRIFGDAETADRQVGAMIFIVSRIMDKCVPKIMRVIWNDDEDEED